jgi:hypothetical protein
MFPSITGIFEQLDGQRPGSSLYDLIMATRFVRLPRERRSGAGNVFQHVVYESVCGSFKYSTDLVMNRWSTRQETLEMVVKEPAFYSKQFYPSPPCESIFIFTVVGMGKVLMKHDLRQGQYLSPLVPEFCLSKSRDHEWNYCWVRENPKTFFNRTDFDEIWKAMMLLKVSIDRTDPNLRMRNRWWSRRNVSTTLFRRHLENGDRKPYVP